MRKLWLAVSHEYIKTVRQKTYLLALFSLPLFIALMAVVGIFMSSQNNNSSPIGYVDRSGLFDNPIAVERLSGDLPVEFIPFSKESSARTAIESGEIQAYFILPIDYPENNNIELIYFEELGEKPIRDIYDFLQFNVLKSYEEEIRIRAAVGHDVTIRTADGTREFPESGPTLNMFLPLIISFSFIMLLLIGSGYLVGGFLEEKSNRTIELMVTSLSPAQLVMSKLLNMIALGFTMMATWIIVGVVAYFIGANILNLDWIQIQGLNWRDVLSIILVAIPSYIIAAALMFSIGLLFGGHQEAESIGPIFFLIAFIPLWFAVPIANDLNGSLAIILSILPITSLLTIGFRTIFMQIPLWQILLSSMIHVLCVLAALWLAVRTFRIGLLRYGKRIRIDELIYRQREVIGEEA